MPEEETRKKVFTWLREYKAMADEDTWSGRHQVKAQTRKLYQGDEKKKPRTGFNSEVWEIQRFSCRSSAKARNSGTCKRSRHRLRLGLGLGVSADPDGDGVSGCSFLAYHQKVNMTALRHQSHAVWRDQDAAMKSVGLSGFAHLIDDLLHLITAPFDSASRHHQGRSSTQEYLQHHAESCLSMTMYKPDGTAEVDVDAGEFDGVSEWEARMLADWMMINKGFQVKMCRFLFLNMSSVGE